MSKQNRLRRLAAAALSAGLAVALLSGCGANGDEPKTPARDALVIGQGNLVSSLDPHLTMSDALDRASLGYVYDRLIAPDFNGGWVPSLATKWAYSADGEALTFTLRDDVVFQDGEKFDAFAAKYNFDRIMDPANKARQAGGYKSKFTGAEAVDATHFRVMLKHPNDVTAMSSMATFYQVAPKLAAEKGMGLGASPGAGTGPLMVESFQPNDHLTLVPNPKYWGRDKITKVKKVTFLSIPDEAARISALDTKRADIVYPISPDSAANMKTSTTAHAVTSESGGFMNIYLGKWAQKSPLSDVRVRQAVNYAIDRKALTKGIMLGLTEPVAQVSKKGTRGYNPDVKNWPYDPEKAKSLLAEAGYPDGFDVPFQVEVGDSPADKEVWTAVTEMLNAVGIRAKMVVLPDTEYTQKWSTGTGAPLFGVTTGITPSFMPEYFYTQWTGSIFMGVMNDPEYNAAVKKLNSTPDQAERDKLLIPLAAMVQEKAPIALLYPIPEIFAVRDDVHGFAANRDATLRLEDISVGG